MKVDLSIKFKISNVCSKEEYIKKILNFNDNTSIKEYRQTDNIITHNDFWMIHYYGVDLDMMHQLYNDIENFIGGVRCNGYDVNIIINSFNK